MSHIMFDNEHWEWDTPFYNPLDDSDLYPFTTEYNYDNVPPQNKRHGKAKGKKADGNRCGMSDLRGFTKKKKNRAERRRAKINPECDPGYGRYGGWIT